MIVVSKDFYRTYVVAIGDGPEEQDIMLESKYRGLPGNTDDAMLLGILQKTGSIRG